jgi:hypothetical protein
METSVSLHGHPQQLHPRTSCTCNACNGYPSNGHAHITRDDASASRADLSGRRTSPASLGTSSQQENSDEAKRSTSLDRGERIPRCTPRGGRRAGPQDQEPGEEATLAVHRAARRLPAVPTAEGWLIVRRTEASVSQRCTTVTHRKPTGSLLGFDARIGSRDRRPPTSPFQGASSVSTLLARCVHGPCTCHGTCNACNARGLASLREGSRQGFGWVPVARRADRGSNRAHGITIHDAGLATGCCFVEALPR